MTKTQKTDLFTEWALHRHVEQRKMIDEYLAVSKGSPRELRELSYKEIYDNLVAY